MSELTPLDPAIDVTVCVVNWNGARYLPDCLASLRKVTGIQREVLVVDNASSDDSVRIVREDFPETRLLVNTENRGFARANNQAIRRGRGRYFFLLNNDTVLRDGCLESLVRFLDEHPRAGMVAGRLENEDGSVQFRYYPVTLPSLASLTADLLWLNRLWPRGHLGRGRRARQWDPSQPSRMEQIPGACMLVRRELFASTGLFDEDYSFLYEDVDLCARACRASWELWYWPEARLMHRAAASTKLLTHPERALRRFRNMMRYTERYFTGGDRLAVKFVALLGLMIRLPVALGANVLPSARVRQRWKGTAAVYLRLLKGVVGGGSRAEP